MAETTGISWCDHTYNAWIGCTKVSEGCKLCYAERDNERYHWTDRWGPEGVRHKTKTNGSLISWNKEVWYACGNCGWRGKHQTYPDCPKCWHPELRPTRQRVFVNSLSDLFEDRPELLPWRNEFWAISQMCTNLDFLILTKRVEDIKRLVPRDWRTKAWPANIWLGVSVENQRRADERIPGLITQDAALRWLSVEPMLGPVDLRRWLPPLTTKLTPWLQWIVCGGESGPDCRKMDVTWARALQTQCRPAAVLHEADRRLAGSKRGP